MINAPKRDSRRVAQQAVLTATILAAALLLASTAEAWTLDALLRLPLERLMQLRMTAQRTAPEALAIDSHAGADLIEGVNRAT